MLLPLLASLLLAPPDSTWTKTDTWLLVGTSVAIASDCTSSSMGVEQGKVAEANLFLPRYPKPAEYAIVCAWSITSVALISTTLPKKWRRIGLIVLGMIEVAETTRTLVLNPKISIHF